jgi:hydroxylamine dehydrogenase
MRKAYLSVISVVLTFWAAGIAFGADAPVSDATQECLDCHAIYHPGIVADWQKSRHARVTPKAAMMVEKIQRRMSSKMCRSRFRRPAWDVPSAIP